MNTIKATIISIGDELLNGQTINTNATWMASQLDAIGIKTHSIETIADGERDITTTLERCSQTVDIILITGGLGPTKDDITKKTLSKYFGAQLIRNEDHYRRLQDYFESRGREMNELNKTQADIPDNCTYIPNDNGTAPGMWFLVDGTIYMSMPGVPREMKRMMTTYVIPKVQEELHTNEIVHRFIYTVGIGESDLAIKIEDWESALPQHIKLAYLPSLGRVKLRLTASGNSKSALNTEIDALVKQLVQLADKYIYSEEDPLLESVIGSLLKEKGLTISTAESCTGGYIAHQLTSVPGSSAYFEGSVISYSNRIKEEQLGVKPETLSNYGAVSEQTVIEMAEGIREKYNTDIGVSCSGIAGPDGGTSDKPVGTVWIAYADKSQTITKLLQLRTERSVNIKLTSLAVLNLIRKSLSK